MMKRYSLPILALFAACIFSLLAHNTSRVSASSQRPGLFYTATPQYQPQAWMTGGERFPQGAHLYFDNGEKSYSFLPGFAATADASLSPDATHLLFSGKQTAQDAWQVWEVELPGGEPVLLTSGEGDHIKPFYLPDFHVVFAHKRQGRFALETIERTSKENPAKAVPITFAPGNLLPSGILKDGRILFSSTTPLGNGRSAEIFTVYPDGSGIEAYRCDHPATPERSRYGAAQIVSGDIVFTHGSELARFTSASAEEQRLSSPQGEYAGEISEMPQGDWLLPWRANSRQNFTLRIWSSGAKELANASFAEFPSGLNIVEPVVVLKQVTPRRFPSALHEWSYANLLALDARTTRETMPPTPIRFVRVSTITATGKNQTLGTAPVAEDGSFYIQVPGDAPIRFELLDSNSKVVRAQYGWMWAKSGEQRICVGCHTGPEHAPRNAVPEVLNHSTKPANLTGGR